AEPGALRDRLEEAWQSVKAGLVRGLSIGFKPLETEPIKDTMGLRFKAWEWLELSAVTIPANSEASIQTIKSICAPHETVRINGGYKLPTVESRKQINADGSYRLRMPGDR